MPDVNIALLFARVKQKFSLRHLSILPPRRISFLYVFQNRIHYLLHKKPIIVRSPELVKSTPQAHVLVFWETPILKSFSHLYPGTLIIFVCLYYLFHKIHTSPIPKRSLFMLHNHHNNIRCWLRSSADNFRRWSVKILSSSRKKKKVRLCSRSIIYKCHSFLSF